MLFCTFIVGTNVQLEILIVIYIIIVYTNIILDIDFTFDKIY